jgi:hypothetical protein
VLYLINATVIAGHFSGNTFEQAVELSGRPSNPLQVLAGTLRGGVVVVG